ncbi:hypothetical protein [Shinella sp. BYT-45]|uniref:hypothetical protein n=1 Tax=Shinella sp. BYT-45 TaxID=3377377 RepID=UPI00397F8871
MKTLEDLIPKLVEKTRDGSLSWSQGIGNDGYKTTFGKYRVDVWQWQDEDETEGITVGLKIGDNATDFIDKVYYDTYSSRYSRLDDLYSMARRSALKIDKIIEDVDVELDKTFGSLFD